MIRFASIPSPEPRWRLLKLLEATRARGPDGVLAAPGRPGPQGPGGTPGARGEGAVRRGRVPPSREHVRGRAGQDLIVRVEPSETSVLLKEPGAKPFTLAGRGGMAGWLLVD